MTGCSGDISPLGKVLNSPYDRSPLTVDSIRGCEFFHTPFFVM